MDKEKITVIVVIVLWVTYFTPSLVIFGDILNTTPLDISEGICLPSYEKQLRCGSTRRELPNFLLKVCSNTSVSLWKYTCVSGENVETSLFLCSVVSVLVFCRPTSFPFSLGVLDVCPCGAELVLFPRVVWIFYDLLSFLQFVVTFDYDSCILWVRH